MFHSMGLFCLSDLIMSQDINHVNCSSIDSSHWLNFPEFITGHMVYNSAYNWILQEKETMYNKILAVHSSFNQ